MSHSHVILVVGDPTDVHAAAVVEAIGSQAAPVLLDASTLASSRWRWSDTLEVRIDETWVRPSTGWLRRLAPPGWNHGTSIGSLGSVEAQAALQLLAAVADSQSPCRWLTDYWSMMRAENKLIQNHLLLLGPRRFRLAFWGHGANLQSDNPHGLKERFKRWTTNRVDWWFAYTQMSADLP